MSARLLVLLFLLLGSEQIWAQDRRRHLYLLPEGFSGWACVDFGVTDAPALPREGDTLLIRVRAGEVLKTSDKAGPIPPTGEAQVEARGKRAPLPEDVYARRLSSVTDTNNPVERHCVFFGTQDAVDAAGDAPGIQRSPREARGVSPDERQALVALFEATNGSQWKHRVGWLGPPGTECSWHGVGCEPRFAERSVVKNLDLYENNLVGSIPKALEQLTHLEWLYLFGNHMNGKLPDALLDRWLEGSLEVSADPPLVTDVSEVSYASESMSLLCGQSQVVLRADNTASFYVKRCQLATPDDRTTFCEVKTGRIAPGAFGRLGVLVERSGFFGLQPNYRRMVIDSGEGVTSVTRRGATHHVTNTATAGPMELWSVQRAIEGVAATVEWEKVTREPECPSGRRVR